MYIPFVKAAEKQYVQSIVSKEGE